MTLHVGLRCTCSPTRRRHKSPEQIKVIRRFIPLSGHARGHALIELDAAFTAGASQVKVLRN
jgi:hypothetical protein